MNVNNISNILVSRLMINERKTNGITLSVNSMTNKMINMNKENYYIKTKYNELKNELDYLKNELKPSNEWRTYDGSSNNVSYPLWGSANTKLIRLSPSDYKDGKSSLAERGTSNPNPRVISNSICKATTLPVDDFKLSNMVWVWGQFLDHEIDLTPDNEDEKAYITTDEKDPNEEYPRRTIFFHRSQHIPNSSPREHPNIISSFVDATNVYGANTERAFHLRVLDGSGKLKTSLADNKEVLMPYNVGNLRNISLPGIEPTTLFVAGDIRANENILLSSIHTLFVREHNRLCDLIVQNDSSLFGKEELIYQKARKLVCGIMQKITYDEFLPAILGNNMFSSYSGYNKNINPSVSTEFSTAGYRLGHSMLSSKLQVGENPLNYVFLKEAFFKPLYLKQNGIEQLLLGASKSPMKKINNQIIDDVRNFLFGPPTNLHLLDLATLNIQRGRDHGIPGYNDVREGYGLLRKSTFAEITSDAQLQTKLQNLYTSPDYIDPWVGALCEDHIIGSSVGELVLSILTEQFRRVRDGDRFWYQNDKCIGEFELGIINSSSLSNVIVRNTNLSSLHENVFKII